MLFCAICTTIVLKAPFFFAKIISCVYAVKTDQIIEINRVKNYASNSVRPFGKDKFLVARNSSTILVELPYENDRLKANNKIEYWNFFVNSTDSFRVQFIADKTLFSDYNKITQTFWLCMDDKIMLFKNGEYIEFKYQGNSFIVNSLYFDAVGNTWIASNNGLYLYDTLQQVRLLTKQDG